jgi:hypothetical protein
VEFVLENFNVIPGNIYLFSTIHNMMIYNEYRLSGADIFFLCNGLDISYESDLNYIGYIHPEELILHLVKDGVIKTHAFFDQNHEELFGRSSEVLLKYNPVLLFLNTQKLAYHKKGHPESNLDFGLARLHTVALYGINLEKDIVYIGDSFLQDMHGRVLTYRGPVPVPEIRESLIGFAWFEKKGSKNLSQEDIFRKTAENLALFLKGKRAGKQYRGNLALKKYVEDFKNLMELDDDLFTNTCLNVQYSLTIHSADVVIEYLNKMVKEVAEYRMDNVEPLIEKLMKLKNEWDKIGLIMVKAGKSLQRQLVYESMDCSNKLLAEQDGVFYDILAYIGRGEKSRICI